MKRPLFICGFGFIVSTAVCFYFGISIAFTLAAITAAGGLLFIRDSRAPVAAAVAALAAVGVYSGFMALRVEPVRALIGQRCTAQLTLTRVDIYGSHTVGEGIADLTAPDGSVRHRVSVRVSVYGERELLPGDCVTAEVRIQPVGVAADTMGRHIAAGRYITLALPGDYTVMAASAHPVEAFLARLRHQITEATFEDVGGDAGALLGAFLTGDRRALSNRAVDYLSRSGLVHLTAVSGMHITLAAGTVVSLWPGGGRRWRYLAGVATAFGYAGLAGFSPSALRAAIMFLIYAVGQVFMRRQDGLTSLAVAGVALCLFNPLCVGGVGFQLSFLATLGILVVTPEIKARLTHITIARFGRVGWLGPVIESLSVSCGATLFTAPVTALIYGYLPLIGILANLLVAAVMPLVLGFTGLMTAANLLIPGLRTLMAPLARIGAGLVMGVARFTTGLPLGGVRITEPYQRLLILGLVMGAVWLIRIKPGKRVAAAALLCTFCILCSTFLAHRLLIGGTYRQLTFEGMGTTVLHRYGEAVVFDLPDSAYEVSLVAEALEFIGVRQVSFATARRAASLRLLGERIPLRLCSAADGGLPVTADAALPSGGHVVSAMGLAWHINDGALLPDAGQKDGKAGPDYAIISSDSSRPQ